MILVDTSVWIDHLRRTDEVLSNHLLRQVVLMHPFVVGELALGRLEPRDAVLLALRGLQQAQVSTDADVVAMIERESLFGTGIGYVDCHLIASTLQTPGARLWTRDRRLREAATRLGIEAPVSASGPR